MSPPGRVVAVLGAESTGKTSLVRALAAHVASRPGWSADDVGAVPEALRLFCDRTGRTPTVAEQDAIAAEQTWRIAEAASRHRLVFADTSAVMTAVYSRFVFGDRSLDAAALAAHRSVDRTLVTALDLPWTPDGHQRDGPHVREPVDRLLRALLRDGGVPYAVVHGEGIDRLRAAWRALAPAWRAWGFDALVDDPVANEAGRWSETRDAVEGDADPSDDGAPLQRRRWTARCACCGDPEGEAAELRALRSRRPTP